jgi:hypothetical protein
MTKKIKKTDKVDQMSFVDEHDWRLGHGGKRSGAGRPKSKTLTKVMRVPEELVEQVQKMIDSHKKREAL